MGEGYTPQLISLLILFFLSFFVLLSEIIFKKPLAILEFLQTVLLLLVSVILFVTTPEFEGVQETLNIIFLLAIISSLIASLVSFYINVKHEISKLTQTKETESVD